MVLHVTAESVNVKVRSIPIELLLIELKVIIKMIFGLIRSLKCRKMLIKMIASPKFIA